MTCYRKRWQALAMLLIFLWAILTGRCSAAEHPSMRSTVMSWLSWQGRGGGAKEDDERHEDPHNPKQRRFWNVGALLELSAEAKENAALHSDSMPPTNGGRGGALTAVKPKRRFLSIPVSPPKFLLTFKSKEEKPMTALGNYEEQSPMASASGVARFWWANLREFIYDVEDTDDTVEDISVYEAETLPVAQKLIEKGDRREVSRQRVELEAKIESVKKTAPTRHQEDAQLQIEKIKPGDTSSSEKPSVLVDVETTKNEDAPEKERKETNFASATPKDDSAIEPLDVEEKTGIVASNFDKGASAGVGQTSDFGDDNESQQDLGPAIVVGESPYMSSGAVSGSRFTSGQYSDVQPMLTEVYQWQAIDKILSLGLSNGTPQLRLSRHVRPIRKAIAQATGLHGAISGKPKLSALITQPEEEMETLDEEDLGLIRRRIAAIDRARKSVELKQEEDAASEQEGRGLFGRRRKVDEPTPVVHEYNPDKDVPIEDIGIGIQQESSGDAEARRSQERVMEIDRLIKQSQVRLLELACEKDALQMRPNPLYNYTTTEDGNGTVKFSREFSFPSETLVEDYLDDLFAHGRLIKMNHTHLWKSGVGFDDDEDESIGDDLLTPSADASRLYSEYPQKLNPPLERRNVNGNGGGGSWILRQSIGKGGSLGEKIGEAAEIAGYKAVCTAVMSSLARSISAIHGMNIMDHSDIRLFMEQVPDLPPLSRTALPRNDYAEEAIKGAMMKSRKRKKKGGMPKLSEETFIQRDAIVETLLSHCQISAPLLKLFPLAWQRALLANMITLITHVISDFAEGIELQILGHALTFSFKPITESDMIRHIGLADKGINHRRTKPEEFEAAVMATAEDVSQGLKILDRWHERALGSGMLRAQIANLIARLVLTLADEVLSGARMDLWAAQAGGPRVLGGLEYRTTPTPTPPQPVQ